MAATNSSQYGIVFPSANWSELKGSVIQAIALTIIFLLFVRFILPVKWVNREVKVKAPFVGYRSKWEPTFLLRMRFTQDAPAIINIGYEKFKNAMFKICRNDSDILIISNKYIEELRSLPESEISAIEANIKNLLGEYSKTDILLESDLHFRVLQNKLTPNLGRFIPITREEVEFGTSKEMPECNEWTSVDMQHAFLRIIARVSSRVILGFPTCRNENWLNTSITYTENVFRTIITLRMLPKMLHPIVTWLLPSSYRIHQNLHLAEQLIIPLIKERRKAQAEVNLDYRPPVDLLQWMMDAAEEGEGQPSKLAQRCLILTLAAIHTSSMATIQCLYDLCAHPEYFAPLREEIERVLIEDGGWTKTTVTKMWKMDSFLKESQRMNPPSLLAFNRIAKAPITLHDNITLPKGTHFAVASAPILHDPSIVPNPTTFSPFRSYLARQEPGESTRHQWTTTDKDHLHFGAGKYSCPGRFFAANEIKIILGNFLLMYDFKYPEGESRPENLTVDTNIFPKPNARLMVRKREVNGKVPLFSFAEHNFGVF